MRRWSLFVVLVMMASVFALSVPFASDAKATTLFVGGAGPGNYTFISAAVYDADPGDTVHVYSGTYRERLTISRPVSLVGEDRNTTTIDAGGVGSPIQVSASQVSITGFRIKGGESDSWNAGIVLDGSQDCHIHNNTISLNNGYGVSLYFSSRNVIEGNNISSNGFEGVELYESSNNIVAANSILSNGWEGVLAQWSPNNTIANNIIQNNTAGVHIYESPNNTVAYNNLTDNYYGIYVDTSSGNRIYHNNFMSNDVHAGDNTSGNQWDDGYPSGGNYWSGYWVSDVLSGPDQDQPGGDGLGDVAYDISRGPASDRYPLIDPQVTEHLPPSAPRSLQATVRSQQAVLTWDPPNFNGNSPVTGYAVYRGLSPLALTYIAAVGANSYYVDAGLINGQTYYYGVSAQNAVGEEGPLSNKTSAVPANELPSCGITAPVSGATVSGLYLVAGTASDTDGTVDEVEVRIDEGMWKLANGVSHWRYAWDTETSLDGNHTIYARSSDGTNHSEEVSVTVTVYNPEPHGDVITSIFEEVWFWLAVVFLIIVSATVLLFLWLSGKRSKREG